ncbi:MAG: type 1 periplasmic binding fold superfamily protein [Flavobacterium sp.]|nr:type 1 periplasmic binding fold superfamily protein [Flavobacterium sp.]
MKTLKLLSFAAIALFFNGCSTDDNPLPINEEELITTVQVTLTSAGSDAILLTYRDLDGDGPGVPQVTVSGNLNSNTIYDGSIQLLNESVTPSDNITLEITEEAEDHQFFYGIPSVIGSVAYAAPNDADGNPVGVNFELTTISAGTGNFTVILKHEPNKLAAGVAQGDVTNAGGETDVEVSFPIIIQ